MKAAWIAMMAFATPAQAGAPAEPVPVTDEEAASEAKKTLALAKRLWEEASVVCRSDDETEKWRIYSQAASASRSFDTSAAASAARRPYMDCGSAVADVSSHIGNCLTGPRYSTSFALLVERHWAEDTASCAAAIKKPDLTFKHAY